MVETRVALDVPADPVWVHMVRAVVAAAADPSRFDVDRLDDLGLAVGEAVTSLFDVDGADRLHASAVRQDDGVRVELAVSGEDLAEEEGAPRGLLAYLLQSIATNITPLSSPGTAGVAFTVTG